MLVNNIKIKLFCYNGKVKDHFLINIAFNRLLCTKYTIYQLWEQEIIDFIRINLYNFCFCSMLNNFVLQYSRGCELNCSIYISVANRES